MSISSESSASRAAKMSEEPAAVTGPPGNVVTGLIKAVRPRQWVKNLLVLIAPVAALGSDVNYDWREVAVKVSIAFVVFCWPRRRSIWSTTPATSRPTVRTRPNGSGPSRRAWCPAWLAYCTGGGARRRRRWRSRGSSDAEPGGGDGVYIAMQLAYCFGLKHQAVLDICIVSSAYLIRAIAGGVAANIPLSQWFLLVMAFGSLFMVAGKRYAELQFAETTGAKIRKSLESYTSRPICGSSGRCRRPRWCCATACGRSSATAPTASWFAVIDDPVHDRDPALRRRRRRRVGRRTGGDRAAGPGAAAAGVAWIGTIGAAVFLS